MNATVRDRIRKAVEQGIIERRSYFDVIGLPDEQALGPPAAETELAALESRLAKRLPPSYRAFLELYDGWRMVDGGVDLLSVSELLGGTQQQAIHAWQQKMMQTGDEVGARGLVIGVSSVTPTRYLLDPAVIGDDGEWRFVQHHKEEEADCSSFLEWLEESVKEYQDLARMEASGSIEDDED